MSETVKPVIGITACNRTVGVENAHAVIERYTLAATHYGNCHALLVPPIAEGFEARAIAGRLDGLMLTGSPSNIAASLYGQSGGEGPFDAGRDTVSLSLIEAMLSLGKPVFGICRGFQEINVLLGGTLRRDLGERHHAPDGVSLNEMFAFGHAVTLSEDGMLRQAIGKPRIWVNSVHYQGVDRLAEGLSVEARADDGLVEAFSANISGACVMAVQWHPEWQTSAHHESQVFFQLMGRAIRGLPVNDPA